MGGARPDVAGSVPDSGLIEGPLFGAVEKGFGTRSALKGGLMKASSENRSKRRGRRRESLARDRKLLLAALRVWELKNPRRM